MSITTRFEMGQHVMLITSMDAFEALKRNDRAAKLAELGTEENEAELYKIDVLSFAEPVEHGHIIGIGVYGNGSPPSYLVRYRSGDGRQVEQYHSEDALVEYDEAERPDFDGDADEDHEPLAAG